MYYIYHIPGIKVGATSNPRFRFLEYYESYGRDVVIEIIEEWPEAVGVEFVGDREWYWADNMGYDRGWHYSRSFSKWDKEDKSLAGKLGFKKQMELGKNPFQQTGWAEIRSRHAKAGKSGWLAWTKEQWSRNGARAGHISVKSPKNAINRKYMCDEHNKSGSLLIMKRYHKNCKLREL
jgi:hypothetical protein